jgi:hypothetical protein
VPYFLSEYDPDPLRFYLTATAPDTRDTEVCPEELKGSPGRISSSATTPSCVQPRGTNWSPALG